MYRVTITNTLSLYCRMVSEFPTQEAAGRYIVQYLAENRSGPYTVEVTYEPQE